jgi:hypothetical protein
MRHFTIKGKYKLLPRFNSITLTFKLFRNNCLKNIRLCVHEAVHRADGRRHIKAEVWHGRRGARSHRLRFQQDLGEDLQGFRTQDSWTSQGQIRMRMTRKATTNGEAPAACEECHSTSTFQRKTTLWHEVPEAT